MAAQSPWRWREFREYLQWRGPLIVTLLVFRELLRPFLYWHLWQIYETDISLQVPRPYAKGEFAVRIYTGRDDLGGVTPMIVSMGELALAEVNLRFAKGHVVGVAYSGEQPVGYMWLAFSCGPELAFDTSWIIRSNEAVRYGSFVIQAFRGRGIHSFLNTAINNYARQSGIVKTLGSVSVLNPQSISLPKHYHREIAMTVFLARVRGLNWTIRRSFEAPLESRFSWPRGEATEISRVSN